MSEPETHDFMSVSVDSFSQLPFIRPTPARDKPSNANASSSPTAIRLFGFDFPHDPNSSAEEPSNVKETPTSTSNTNMSNNNSNSNNNNNNSNAAGGGGSSDGTAGRKFECHYCCRNFPTSQALGGHQNAHKRERQHAKRAHLQSAMAAHHHHAAMLADGGAHVYGLINYHRLGSVPSAARFEPPPPPHYPSWTSSNPSLSPAGARFYSGIGSMAQPINGNPLPGLWRVPSHSGTANFSTAYRDRSVAAGPLPLFGGDDSTKAAAGAAAAGCGSSPSSSSSSSSTSQERGGYGSSGKDSVSLDLHL
ncbi:zinc finger protein 8 [Ananas comosus]|uniref:Zinc finger protein 8 n=1 Tax=Ananas comosus TaxID=4615 RepID=A0A6P5GLC3_ANACO|nr:zinc finger protein 8 [Ananas comosus]